MNVYDERIPPELRKAVRSIARRLERALKDANAIGLILFAASGSAQLRPENGWAGEEVADLDGDVEGGDGGDLRDHQPAGECPPLRAPWGRSYE